MFMCLCSLLYVVRIFEKTETNDSKFNKTERKRILTQTQPMTVTVAIHSHCTRKCK